MHFVSESCEGEECGPCKRAGKIVDAKHKVGEEFLHDDPEKGKRHNFTQYVCCECFMLIFGPWTHS